MSHFRHQLGGVLSQTISGEEVITSIQLVKVLPCDVCKVCSDVESNGVVATCTIQSAVSELTCAANQNLVSTVPLRVLTVDITLDAESRTTSSSTEADVDSVRTTATDDRGTYALAVPRGEGIVITAKGDFCTRTKG